MKKNKSVILLYGDDIPGIYAAKDRFVQAEADEEVERIAGEKADAHTVAAHLAAHSLFGGKRRLEFINPKFLQGGDSDAAWQELQKSLQNIDTDTCVVFLWEGSLDKRRKAVKWLVSQVEAVEVATIPHWKVVDEMQMYLRNRRYRLAPKAVALLRELVEGWETISTVFIHTECDKWMLMSATDTITEDIVRDALPSYMNPQVFSFWDDLAAGDRKNILEKSDKLFSGRDEIKNMGYILSQLRYSIMASEYLRQGLPLPKLAQALKIAPFRAEKIGSSLRTLSAADCAWLLQRIYVQQRRWRSGIQRGSWREVWLELWERKTNE